MNRKVDTAAIHPAMLKTSRFSGQEFYKKETGISKIITEMTLDEKIGQLTQPTEDAVTEAQIIEFHIGAIQGAFSDVRTPKDPRRLARKVRDFQKAALCGRFQIPLFYGMDAPHGHSALPTATIFPHNIGLGATNDCDRINDAVRRILGAKEKLGLLNDPEKALPKEKWVDIIGCDAHRKTARHAVRKSLVLLKNESSLLPIKGSPRILVTGKNANDLGNQCGGWTLSNLVESGHHIHGTTILQSIQSRAAQNSSTVTYVDSRGTRIVLDHHAAELWDAEGGSLSKEGSPHRCYRSILMRDQETFRFI